MTTSTVETAAPGRTTLRSLRALVLTARPIQWQKNALLFAGFIFSADAAWSIDDPARWLPMLGRVAIAFVIFGALSSGQYFVNDALDAEQDREHPRKRLRPVASGEIPVPAAATIGLLLLGGGLLASFALAPAFGLTAVAYVALLLAYSVALKHLVIVDVIVIASGFTLRAIAGAVVIDVPVSPWLYVVTTLGALFIAVAKRRQELVLLDEAAVGHRGVLGEYSLGFLDRMLSVASAATIVAYALYAATAENLPADHSMLFTLPFVLYGIFRYQLIAERSLDRQADELILRDGPLLGSVAGFALTALVVLMLNG